MISRARNATLSVKTGWSENSQDSVVGSLELHHDFVLLLSSLFHELCLVVSEFLLVSVADLTDWSGSLGSSSGGRLGFHHLIISLNS